MHYKHNTCSKNQTSTIKLILPSHANALNTVRGLAALYPICTQHSCNYIYNMIYVTVKTYVTNFLFTTQAQLPQYNLSHLAQKSTPCNTWPCRIKPQSMQRSHTHTHIYIRNMISVTLNTSVANLTFTINSRCPKMKLRRP
jgi:hypothetical protein